MSRTAVTPLAGLAFSALERYWCPHTRLGLVVFAGLAEEARCIALGGKWVIAEADDTTA